MEIALLALAGSATALATGLGAIPISHLGVHADELDRRCGVSPLG